MKKPRTNSVFIVVALIALQLTVFVDCATQLFTYQNKKVADANQNPYDVFGNKEFLHTAGQKRSLEIKVDREFRYFSQNIEPSLKVSF